MTALLNANRLCLLPPAYPAAKPPDAGNVFCLPFSLHIGRLPADTTAGRQDTVRSGEAIFGTVRRVKCSTNLSTIYSKLLPVLSRGYLSLSTCLAIGTYDFDEVFLFYLLGIIMDRTFGHILVCRDFMNGNIVIFFFSGFPEDLCDCP